MNIEIKGLKELQAKLQRIHDQWRSTMERATDKAVKYVHSQVPPYPEIGESSYRRTHNLENTLYTEVRSIGSEVVGVIGSPMVYAPYVISTRAVGSRGPQTEVHKRHGWYTLQGVVKKAKDEVKNILREAVRALLNGG